jgi:DNA-binding MarR family transcriptional regulator
MLNGRRDKLMSRTRPQAKKAKGRGSARKPADAALTVTLPQFLVGGADLAFREFVADLFAAVSGMQSLRRALARSIGLSVAEFSVLLATWHLQKQGQVGVITIARHLHVAAAHVTAEVGKLVAAGLIRKTPDPDDARAVILVTTRTGESILMKLAPLLRQINDRLFSTNTPSDIAVVSKFLRHIVVESATATRVARTFCR